MRSIIRIISTIGMSIIIICVNMGIVSIIRTHPIMWHVPHFGKCCNWQRWAGWGVGLSAPMPLCLTYKAYSAFSSPLSLLLWPYKHTVYWNDPPVA